MKVIIPVAGEGRRLRPHTYTKPKPLLAVAGKPIIDHIMDKILPLAPSEIIFITGHFKEKLENHLRRKYEASGVKLTFIEQTEINGTAGAVGLARDAFDEDVLIDFGDTIFDADLSIIKECTDDGILWAMPVEDYQRFGVIVVEHSYAKRIVEKPNTPVSRLANIGLYYIKNTKLLEKGIDHTLTNAKSKEFYLTDAFEYMITHGAKLKVIACRAWFDCGTAETLLATNKTLLSKQHEMIKNYAGVRVVAPVSIDSTAQLENSTVGPYVSIAAGVVVKNSILKNCIIDERTEIHDATLTDSIIGADCHIKGKIAKVNLGDHSRIE